MPSAPVPTSLTNIGKDAFANTAWQKNQGDFPVVNGILIGYEGEGGVVTIPENVTAINTGAFAWCSSNYGNSNVTEIIIPDTVKSIGNQAFYYCTNLTTAVLPGSVTAIPEGMFQSCVSLTSVTIPEGVTRIEKSAFEACSNLTRIELPDGVTTIGNDAFSWCESLTQITIPASVTKIGGDAFDSVSTDLVIIGDVDSYAQQFATDRGFQFRCYMPLGTVELSKTVYTYSGEPCTPDATVRDSEGNLLEEGVDYVVTYSDNIDAGTATATVTGIGLYLGTITATYSIQPAAQALVVTPSAVTVGMGETVQLNVTGFGTLHFSINQPNVATVGANGLVKGLTVGSAVITVKADGDRNHRAAATTVPVTVVLATPQITGVISQNNGVQISWNAVPGAAKYRVFHKTGTGNWQGLGNTTGLTFTDTTAVVGVAYDYTVRCVSADEKTYTSSFDPVGKTITYIATPVLRSVENVRGGVQISWNAVPGAAKYRVFHKTGTGNWQIPSDVSLRMKRPIPAALTPLVRPSPISQRLSSQSRKMLPAVSKSPGARWMALPNIVCTERTAPAAGHLWVIPQDYHWLTQRYQEDRNRPIPFVAYPVTGRHIPAALILSARASLCHCTPHPTAIHFLLPIAPASTTTA